jgi:AmmeMemoRadiSam system protein B
MKRSGGPIEKDDMPPSPQFQVREAPSLAVAADFRRVSPMKKNPARWLLPVLLILVPATFVLGADPAIKALLDSVGIKPEGSRRGQMDVVGFASNAAQMDAVLSQCDSLAAPRLKTLASSGEWPAEAAIKAGVCPHDDYYYAGRLYSLLLPHVRAHTVVIFGVFHKARVFDCRDRLVFDSYSEWHGPYGPVKVSPIREEIIERLPSEDFVVDNDMQMVEHSVEALVPFLQAYDRGVEIVSILVPYMDWATIDREAQHVADALAAIAKERGWKLGDDICVISSCDAVHYGDSDWGGKNFADFGTDVRGYQAAVDRDLSLAKEYLSGKVDRPKLRDFLYRCVKRDDVTDYAITWCGRFSVPFGLNVATRLAEKLGSGPLVGQLLDYGTSVSEASLDLGRLGGLGATAPNNLHHWVGYAAIAYR